MINYCSHWGSWPASWGATLLWDVFRSVFLSKWITDPTMSPMEVSTSHCCSLAMGFISDIYPGLTLRNFPQKGLNWIYSNQCKSLFFQNGFSKLVLPFFRNHKNAYVMFISIHLSCKHTLLRTLQKTKCSLSNYSWLCAKRTVLALFGSFKCLIKI